MNVISLKNLEKRFEDHIIFKGVNADIERGEVVSIIGPSGTGKSTLLRAVNFLDPATGGEVFFKGVKVDKQNIDITRRKMGMVFQNFGLFSHLDVMGNLTVGPIKLLKKSASEAEAAALQLLKLVGMAERAHHFPYQLSGGQRQRVAIARCLAMQSEVILFDEPTSSLDPTMLAEVMAVIRNLAKSGMTMLVVTHEMEFAREIANRVFYMDEQSLYEEGSPEDIFNNPKKPKTQEFILKIRSFSYEIKNRDFDFAEMLGGVENFCFRHAVDKKIAGRLQLIAEELVVNIIAQHYGECSLKVSFSSKLGNYTLTVGYKGANSNILEIIGDDLPVILVKKSAKTVKHEYIDEVNIITATL
ncbi:MAG: ATP-binding cassette domain-containing protein [Deferribacteraceae bacterium]|jgi:polar amino acid transport system ATP-binding protein|nr:ATP-binding cassette domain-containing protein [Deferribacteraceae bacterium]